MPSHSAIYAKLRKFKMGFFHTYIFEKKNKKYTSTINMVSIDINRNS